MEEYWLLTVGVLSSVGQKLIRYFKYIIWK